MTKRSIGIVVAVLALTAGAVVGLYFGLGGQFTSSSTPVDPKDNLVDKPNHEDDAPPDASLYRPASVGLARASAFLYTGKSPRQVGMDRGALRRRRAAVLRGQVLTADGKPLAGVEVGAVGQSEVGRTHTDADGGFDLAVNGGGSVVVSYKKEGVLPAQRQAAVPWQDYVWLPEVVLISPGAQAGVLELPTDETAPAVRGVPVKDDEGTRQATFLAPPGFAASLVFSDGEKPLNRLTLSVAEYSVGASGASALPASLPPGAGCVYAVEIAAEEGREPGAREVRFRKPLIQYVENFLKFPVGAELPSARYDSDRSVWLQGPPGRVVRVLDVKDGLAILDLDGKGEPADTAALAVLGVSEQERRHLGSLYGTDATLWRLPLTGLGAWAVSPLLLAPDGAVAPSPGLASATGDDPAAPRPQPAVETLSVPGTHFLLCYSSERAPGCKAPYTLKIGLSGPEVPKPLKRIDLEIQIAGRRLVKSFPIKPNQETSFIWDGLDAYNRPVQGRWPAQVRIGYVYDAVPPARQECILWLTQRVLLGDWDARAASLGGWTINIHHAYDPIGRVLHLGGGARREGLPLPQVIATVAGGTGVLTYNDDDIPATGANLSQPRGLAVGPDGSLYIADAGQQRIRRVGADGLISTVAGTGRKGYDGDNRTAVEAELNTPTGLTLGTDGSLYIADDGNNRVRRLRPDGSLTNFAGQGGKLQEYGGDGGPALSATGMSLLRGLAAGPGGDVYIAQIWGNQCVRRVAPNGIVPRYVGGPGKTHLDTACAVAAAPDGVLFVADGDGCRVWRVGLDGAASIFAGTGKAGFSGDGGPAVKAELNSPSGLAVGPDGSVYIADAANQRIRCVSPQGKIDTVAGRGKGETRETGDGGPATDAVLRLSERIEPGLGRLCGLAVGPEGELYIADVGHGSVRRVAPPFSGISDSEILLTSEEGAELYIFDGVGRHLQTLDAATGAVLYRFGYDAAWRLTEIHDSANALTRIERDKAGRPRALIGPGGERTTLAMGDDGRLKKVVFPAGEGVEMEYDPGGLLTSFTDAQRRVAQFSYDESGRLVKD
jgi:YD repeat-containing protein